MAQRTADHDPNCQSLTGEMTTMQLSPNAFRIFLVVAALLSNACDRAASTTIRRPTTPLNDTQEEIGADAPRVLFDAPRFQLTDQNGKSFGSSELSGNVWIATFMFTHCVATCPKQTARFETLQRQLQSWPDADRVWLVSITVDPERDTVEQLRQYADQHQADDNHWRFLRGDRAEIVRISKEGFMLPVSDESDEADDASAPITHSAQFALVDTHGRVRGLYDGLSADDCQKLLTDTRFLLSEPKQATNAVIHLGVPDGLFDKSWLEERAALQRLEQDSIRVRHDFQFEDVSRESGITFISQPVADCNRNFSTNHYDHGTGICVADVDGDGNLDIYFLSQVGGNELWRNLGNGRFENVTESAGVGLVGRVSVAASFADTDNDGDVDLFVTTTRHGNVFFVNDGSGHFQDRTTESGLVYVGHSSAADFFDYDRDGKLDLFLSNVGTFTKDELEDTVDRLGRSHPYYAGRTGSFLGHVISAASERSILYRNLGANQFKDVSRETELMDYGWTGDATPIDFNNDGWLDLYVLNMQGNDQIYENVNGERFVARGNDVFPESVWGGMSAKSFDFNNDGTLDLMITNMHADMWQLKDNIRGPREKLRPPHDVMPETYFLSRNPGHNILGNALFQRDKDNAFRDVALETNAETFWPWGLSVGDLNADGFQDLFIASCMNYPFRYHVNSLLLNDEGLTFRDAEFVLGIEPRRGGKTATPWFELDCSGRDREHDLAADREGKLQVWGALGTRSAVIFDYDQDGDLDIVTNDFNSPPMVLRSDLSSRAPERLHFLKIVLRGTTSNRDGLGSKVVVSAGGKSYTQVHDGQSGYLSQSALPLYFGLGEATTVDLISITWPNGRTQIVTGPIGSNQQLKIEEPTVDGPTVTQFPNPSEAPG